MKRNRQIFFKEINSIFPVYLVLLSMLPSVIGFFIEPDLVYSREIIINLVWIPFFSISSILFNKKIILQFANLIFFIGGFIEIGHWIILRGPISITSILVISNTNIQEAGEFFNLKATYGLLILIPYSIIFILSVRQPFNRIKLPFKSYILWFVMVFSIIFVTENAIHGRLIRKGIPHFSKVICSYYNKINLFKEARKTSKAKKVNALLPNNIQSQTFVLILGESCNKNHMSLYGYKRNTTPRLNNRKDIIVFDNVVSPYSNTLYSVLTILSERNLENKIELLQGVDVFDIFSSAGFKTYWISNQSPIGIWDNLVTVFSHKADYKKFVNIFSNSSFEATYTKSYDSKLFKPFCEVLNENVKKKFIVIHLMGSHSSYSKRYPEDFNRFIGNNHRTRIIAEYDNSVLYNDFIVDSLLRILETKSLNINNTISSAIYLSDHGENVYDENERVGHDYSKILPKSNVEIPFIVWLNATYKKQYPLKTGDIFSNKRQPYISDDLFHSILDINCIKSPFLNKKRCIFNSDYDNRRKRVLEDNNNYDNK